MSTSFHERRPRLPVLLHLSHWRKGKRPWVLISVMVIAFLIPYFLPGKGPLELYAAFASIPIGVAGILRERKGSLTTWFLLLIGLFLGYCDKLGFAWPTTVLLSWIFGNIGGLVFAITIGQVCHMRSQLTAAQVALQKQALTDPLTGLPNHRAVLEQLDKEVERARRFERPLSLVFFDADRFKRVNDTYGHAVGDTLLLQLGERVMSTLHGGDTLGRYGGEEFVILLPETDAEQAREHAEQIRATVAALPLATHHLQGGIAATISLGIASYPRDGTTSNDLLVKADQAMYLAKHLGRNQIRMASEAERATRNAQVAALIQSDDGRQYTQHDGLSTEQAQQAEQLAMIYSLLWLLDIRGHGVNTYAHHVSELASHIAQDMGLGPQVVRTVTMAALLHDIGKVSIPDGLLTKPGHLSASEWEIMKQHTQVGSHILETIIHQYPTMGPQLLESSPFLRELIPAIRHHHERWDGAGYPDQLAEQAIPVEARIIAVTEAYSAMIVDRPYQKSRSSAEALTQVQQCAGTQFDPTVVQSLSTVLTHHNGEMARDDSALTLSGTVR